MHRIWASFKGGDGRRMLMVWEASNESRRLLSER